MKRQTTARIGLVLLTALSLVAVSVAAGSQDEQKLGDAKKKDSPSYYTVTVAAGRLTCAAGALAVATDELCASIQGWDGSTAKFPVPVGADEGLLEMRWVATSAFGPRELALNAPTSLEGDGATRMEGKSVLRVHLASSHEGGVPADATIVVSAGASHDIGIVVEQDFEIAFSVFVDMAIPDGYSAFVEN